MKFLYSVFILLICGLYMPAEAQQASNAKTNDVNTVNDLNILDFKVALDGNTVNINWETINEYNCSEFVIEKAGEDGNFFMIGAVKAQGSPYGIFDYTFADTRPADGVNYYRLKVCSAAGSKYSTITFVNYVDIKSEPTISPNPSANDFFDIKINSSEVTTLKIYNRGGKLIYETQSLPGQKNITVNARGFTPGLYYCFIESPSGAFQKPLIISN